MVFPDEFDAAGLMLDAVPLRTQLDVSSLSPRYYHVVRLYPFSSRSHFEKDVVSEVIYSSNPSARVFRQDELLKEIFDNFRKDQFTVEERRELLGFMLISKMSFHHPACILWSRIGVGFVAALRLLDLEMWDRNLDRKLFGLPLFQVLERNMARLTSHIMWEKFLYYANAIEWIDATTITVSPGTIALVASLLPSSDPVIFRSLRQLRWTEAYADSNDLLHLLNPSLDQLQLHVYDFHEGLFTAFAFAEWIARICHASAHLCPHIRFFGVEGMGPLIVNPPALSYLTTLHRMTITQWAFDQPDMQIVAPPTVFRALESLEMISYHGSNSLVKSLPYVLSFLTNTLRTVHIQSIAGVSTLESLSFIDNFRSLLDLRQLTGVRINFLILCLQFTDDDLKTVAKAWPSIVELSLLFTSVALFSVPRLETIGIVASLCPSLRKITLPSLLGPQEHDVFAISAPLSHPLEEIRTLVMNWYLCQSDAITSGLSQAFPKLRGVPIEPSVDENSLQAILPPYILHARNF